MQTQFDFDQAEQLDRVKSRLGRLVVDFFNSVPNYAEFHASDLREYVSSKIGEYVAPGSPDRIMRDLRQKQVINYVVVSRSKSLYRKL